MKRLALFFTAVMVALTASAGYIVTLNQNGGSGGTSRVTVSSGESMPSITPPMLDGYVFCGYYDEDGKKYYDEKGSNNFLFYHVNMYGENAYSFFSFWDKGGSGTLYARWQKVRYCTVTLNMQGGSGGTSSVTVKYGDAMPSITVPSLRGYRFGGYKSGNVYYYDEHGNSVRSWDRNEEATTLSAQWWGIESTVELNPQGGSGGTPSVRATYGDSMPSIVVPTRSGYVFCGYWFGGKLYYTAFGESAHKWDELYETTLYAKWGYEVTLDQQGGSGGTQHVRAPYDSVMPSITVPTRAGFAFDGYWSGVNGSGTQYYTASGASAHTWDKKSATTLYAHWGYDILFDQQGGNGGATNVVFYGSAMPSVEVPKRTGYTFCGYWDGKNGTGTQYYTDSGESVRGWDKACGMTLYAKWQVNQYTVTFDANGGTGGRSVTQDYGTVLFVPRVTREHSIFIGWKPDFTGVVPASNTVYVAQWRYYLDAVVNSDGTVSIKGINFWPDDIGQDGIFEIPSVIEGRTVTCITHEAFKDCVNIRSITIPNSVTNIGTSAFSGCRALTSVTIGHGVTSIGEDAFYNCSGLRSVTIPDSVTRIGASAFSGCSGLEEITLPFVGACRGAPKSTASLFGYIFGESSYTGGIATRQCYYNTYEAAYSSTYYIPSKLMKVTITDETVLGNGAFYNCTNLTSVTIPNSVTGITSYAFYNCSSLPSMEIPYGVKSIGGGAFVGCSGLTSVTIPASVTSISGFSGFSRCGSLEAFVVASGNTTYKTVDGLLLSYDGVLTCVPGGLTSVTVPYGVTSIAWYAFYYCAGLTSVTIPDSVTSIGNYAFQGCSGLTSVTIPDSVTSIGNYAFSGCSGLTSVTIPDSVTSISERAFSGCSGLTSVTIGHGVTSIGEDAFYNCSGLRSVTIPDSVTSISKRAFSGCSGLEEISLPFVGARRGNSGSRESLFGYIFGESSYSGGTLTRQQCVDWRTDSYYIPSKLKNVVITDETVLGYGAFCDCSNLTSVTIGNGVTNIGERAFLGCGSLRSVSLPDTVTSIGHYAFKGCSGLTSVTIPDSVTSIGIWAFKECSNLTSVAIPGSVTCISEQAFSCCSGLTNVTIGAGVTSIEEWAFLDCSGLTSVIIPVSVEKIDNDAFVGCTSLEQIVMPEWFAGNLPEDFFLGCPTDLRMEYGNYYGVAFDANGGSVENLVRLVAEGGDVGTLPQAVREGYTFNGWFTEMSGGDMVDAKTKIWESATYHAQWSGLIYAVTLDKQGGAGGTSNIEATCGCGMPSIAVPTRTGYMFGGYWSGTNGGGMQYYNASGASVRTWDKPSAATLYAQWLPICVVTLDRQGGSGGTSSVEAAYGYDMPSITVPMRTGYIFDGYWSATSGGGMQYYTASGVSARIWNKSSAATLYAKWLPICAVTLDRQGGSGGMSSIEVIYNSPMPSITVPKRVGYTFGGYWTGKDGEGTLYYSASGASARNCDMTAATTLYAKWLEGEEFTPSSTYCVIDLSAGTNAVSYPVTYMAEAPEGGFNTSEYKTTKLVLRMIEPGMFKMGGSYDVMLTKPFYCGVFEVTQKQYELVMGTNPSSSKGDMRPVEKVSWDMIRGNSSTYNWPSTTEVEPSTFIGKLQSRTGINFDLPTEAQWEYACRAGTTSKYNNGGASESDLKKLGRYKGNAFDGKGGYSSAHTTVGSYLPNAWGLYDMHGNVYEWCLDWFANLVSATDPEGPSSASGRVDRGGGWSSSDASDCTSSYRLGDDPSRVYTDSGFRIVRTGTNSYIILSSNLNDGSAGATNTIQLVAPDAALPVLTREGYTFDGWWTSANGGTRISNETDAISGTFLYAHWKVNRYTVTFAANGGSGGKTVTQDYGSEIVAPTVTREGYTFNGWSPSVPAAVPAGNATYTAQWKINQYTVTFNANGGTGGKSVTQNYGTALAAPTVTRTGYSFTGWSPSVPSTVPAGNMTYTAQWKINQYTATFNANGGTGGKTVTQNYGTALSAPTVTREGYTFTGWSPAVPSTVPSGNVTYTAQWQINQYTVTFNANGGTGSRSGKQNYGTAIVAPTVTRTGYTFMGWSPSVATTVPANNVTYYAQWKVNWYTARFNANGGSLGTASPTNSLAYGTALGTLPVPTREGYAFAGWYTSAEGGTRIFASTPLTGNVTYYAHWCTFTNVTAEQRYPWNGKVDILYTVLGEMPTPTALKVMATDRLTGSNYVASAFALSGDTGLGAATHQCAWDMSADGLMLQSADVVFTVSCMTSAEAGGELSDELCADDSKSVAIDSRAGALVDSLPISWNAAWVGGNPNATVVIADNGVEVRRVTGAGEFVHVLSGAGRHDLTYTTYIDGWARAEVYTVTAFKEWKYEVRNGGAVLIETTQRTGAITIPSVIDGYPVTGVDEGLFAGCTGVTDVTLPGHLLSDADADGVLGTLSSDRWTLLSRDTDGTDEYRSAYNIGWDFPSMSLTLAGPCEFRFSWKIESGEGNGSLYLYCCLDENWMTMNSVTDGAWVDKSVSVPAGEHTISWSYSFYPWSHPKEGCGWVRIPRRGSNGCVTVAELFPDSYATLESVTLTGTVTEISDHAFDGCAALTSINIPSTVTNIGSSAFADCTSLTSVTIPGSVKQIGEGAFAGCSELTQVTMPGWFEGNLPDDVFEGCPSGMRTEYNIFEVSFNANGGSIGEPSRSVEKGNAVGTLPTPSWTGYTFVGWFTAAEGGEQISAETKVMSGVTYYAHWTTGGGSDDGTGGGSDDGTGGDGTGGDGTGGGGSDDGTGGDGTGGGGGSDGGGTGGGGSVTPQPSDPAAYVLYDAVEGVVPAVATVYDGYLCRNGSLAGTIQVKVGKPGKDGMAAVKATVIGLDGKKKSLKAAEKGKVLVSTTGPTTISLVGGDACEVTLGAKGMGGTYGSYGIDGGLNVFASKVAADKSVAADVLGKWQGAVNVAWRSDATERVPPYQTLSVMIAAKGKAKVSGTLADGTKVSAKGQLVVGEEWCCVPVVESKKAKLAFVVWLPLNALAARSTGVVGLANAIVGKPGTLKAGAAFRLGGEMGDAKYGAYLPNGVSVTGGAKWTLPKAGKVQLAKDGTVDAAKAGANPSGLKLTYKAKDGTFKGSFKAYADVGGKPKGATVKVSGVLVGGVGYGAATVKGGGVSVKVE